MRAPEPELSDMLITRLSFVRHGQGRSNQDRVIRGEATCTGLSELGREQAGMLADRLRVDAIDDPVAAIYSTGLARARETAEIVSAAVGLPVQYLDCLRYPNYGSAEGKGWTEVYAEFARTVGEHPALYPYRPLAEGAEPHAEFLQSMRAAVRTIVDRHRGGHVLVFGSVENILAAAELMQGLPPEARSQSKFAAELTSITTWAVTPASWAPDKQRCVLTRQNDVEHLPRVQRRDRHGGAGTELGS